MAKGYSGYTEKTTKHMLLDAGAFFINYDMGEDTFATAKTEGKLLGATRGGGSFSAIPEIRHIEADGIKGKGKGLAVIESWEVTMGATVIEVSPDVIQKALVAARNTLDVGTGYDKITATDDLRLSDYIDNVTFVGKQSGTNEPLVIQIYNALNTNGLTLTTSDKGESVISLEFAAHYDDVDFETAPFTIWYPSVF